MADLAGSEPAASYLERKTAAGTRSESSVHYEEWIIKEVCERNSNSVQLQEGFGM